MIRSLALTILIEDSAPVVPGLHYEHGLSLWVEADDRRILFDTGLTDALAHNAKMLGIDLAAADAIVLSHGHYDHTGGLRAVLELNAKAAVYCHPGVAVPRYSLRNDGLEHEIGMPEKNAAALSGSGRMRPVLSPAEIAPGIYLTGPVPRLTHFEDTGGDFFLDPEGKRPDPIDDDLSMFIITNHGVVVVAGCCHAGIVNTVRYIQELRPSEKIASIIGGLHLLHASAERREKTITELEKLQLKRIVPCHCTGEDAIRTLRSTLHERVTAGAGGLSLRRFS